MVYVLNNKLHDYSKAKRFGDLKIVTEDNVPLFRTDAVLDILKKRLESFTEEDYLLLSGPVLLNVFATNLLLGRMETLKLVVFDAKQQDYVIRHISRG